MKLYKHCFCSLPDILDRALSLFDNLPALPKNGPRLHRHCHGYYKPFLQKAISHPAFLRSRQTIASSHWKTYPACSMPARQAPNKIQPAGQQTKALHKYRHSIVFMFTSHWLVTKKLVQELLEKLQLN